MRKIILKNQDKTKDIEHYELENETLWVKFFNHDKKYPYSKGKFELLDLEELAESELETLNFY